MIGILYCQQFSFDYQKLEHILCEAHMDVRCLPAEELTASSIEECSMLINTLGSFFPEDKMDLIVDFFHRGKNMIHLGAAPFTKDLRTGCTNNRMLRSLGIVDDFRPVSAGISYVQLASLQGDCLACGDASHIQEASLLQLPTALTGLQSAVYHLCEKDSSGQNRRTGYIEHILDAYDDSHTLIAVPVVRVVTHAMGSMSFFNFNLDAEIFDIPFWKDLLLQVVQKELEGNILLSVDCNYARYTPKEPQTIQVSLNSLTRENTSPLTITLSVYNADNKLVFRQREDALLPYESRIGLQLTESSLYQLVTTVSAGDLVLAENRTGFLVISDSEIQTELQQFAPMYLDETVSGDYCLVNGKSTAILGTTYFVTDVYRECFYYMNAWLCSREMAKLRVDGFNVLRSGNWVHIPALYEENGSISKRSRRALQTFFLLAARNGFTVQFALGNVLLNQWDKSQSPIHHKQMRQKCMTLVRSFAESFRDYPNVTLDIVNEPSYSMKGAWSIGRPSGEPEELQRYREWLHEKYHGQISDLRHAWGETAAQLQTFEDVEMPDNSLFSRGLCRTEQRRNHTVLADFFAFAREEFSDWTREIRAIVKKYAPNMPVVMGRDETLRIPAQQDEILAGNIDMVCWHQWNYNSNILTEYLLNRVRGRLCVAQELGMYKFDDICAGKRHSDEEMASRLTNKLLYAFGNFVQWQAHDDPFMFELSENSLGLYRADMTPTPSAAATRRLIAAEKDMQGYMYHRQYDTTKIATIYNTSYYFSVDHPIAQNGIRSHIYALKNCLKEQADFLPEHLLTMQNTSAIGNPRLIILPAMQTLQKKVWEVLLAFAKNGATILITGCIDKDEHFLEDEKIQTLDSSYHTRKLKNFEKIIIGEKEFVLDFRPIVGYADVTNLLNCGQTAAGNMLSQYSVGKGTILYCPYPLELSSNSEAVCACYTYAIEKAHAHNTAYRLLDGRPNVILQAASYEDCTVYTLINEGFEDTVSWIDLRSNTPMTVTLPELNGCKLWISPTGDLLQKFE